MTQLPPLPEKHRMVQVYKATGGDRSYDPDDYHPYYTEAQMLAFQAATVEACAQVLLESGFRSTGIPAYESLAEKLRGMK